MPGTPPITPNLGLPRFASSDAADYTADTNSIVDALDAALAPSKGVLYEPGDLIFSAAQSRGGCVPADGRALSRTSTTYAALFAAIGTAYGAGDGVTTFNVPDMRARVPVGAGASPGTTTKTMGQVLGEETHVLTEAELASHTHAVNDQGHAHQVVDPGHTHSFGQFSVPGIFEPIGGGLEELPGSFTNPGSRWILWISSSVWQRINVTGRGPTGILVATANTGIFLMTTGFGFPHNNIQPGVVGTWFIKL